MTQGRLESTLLLLVLGSCRCDGGLTTTDPPALRIVDQLTVPSAFLGYSTSSPLEITNTGAVATLALEITPPFFIDPPTVTLGRGVTETVQLTFRPSAAGPARGTLTLGSLAQVEVTSTGLQPPECTAAGTCRRSTLDVALGQCVEMTLAAGSECSTRCITVGACDARQQCVGQARTCDDGDACTIDACDESAGCVSSPRTCPVPMNPCHEAVCDRVSGCGVRDVQDGTVCGRDDCLATSTDVCIAGRCVSRPRPALARCTNRWVPQLPHPDSFVAFDHRRAKLVTIDWSNLETWELQGTWLHRTPLARPASVFGPMFWNPRRQRVQVFGQAVLWEWDGLTWLSRPVPAPPVALGVLWSGAWDEVRGVFVVSGQGSDEPPSSCEWDGVGWSNCASSGHTVRAMSWDPSRRRVISIGSSLAAGPGTFEWRGTSWQRLASAPGDCTVSPDPLRSRVVATCTSLGLADAGTGGTWEWDGGVWSKVSPLPAARTTGQTWDPVSRRTLAFNGEVRAWDGTQWVVVEASSVAGNLSGDATLGWDPMSRRMLLLDEGLVTWAHSDGGWQQATSWGGFMPHALATDTARNRLVLVRATGLMEWDGQQWVDAGVRSPPLAQGFTAVFDQARQQLVLMGGQLDAGRDVGFTWALDGGWVRAAVDRRETGLTAAFEPSSGNVLATFGRLDAGVLSWSSWSWNGSAWSLRSDAPFLLEPTWDPTRQRLLAYDRDTPATLEWTGTGWVSSAIAGTPGPTGQLPSMAFDQSSRRMTLWNGAIWVLLP